MKNQPLLYGICIIVLLAAVVTAGCTSGFPGSAKVTLTPLPATPVPTAVPVDTTTPSTSGFTTCHGSDLACGTNVPRICTEEYRTGDKCRDYASCDTSGGSCTLVTSNPKYTNCKACADTCQVQAGADSLAAVSCEEKC
jgi:hypothetical protein